MEAWNLDVKHQTVLLRHPLSLTATSVPFIASQNVPYHQISGRGFGEGCCYTVACMVRIVQQIMHICII